MAKSKLLRQRKSKSGTRVNRNGVDRSFWASLTLYDFLTVSYTDRLQSRSEHGYHSIFAYNTLLNRSKAKISREDYISHKIREIQGLL